MARIDPKLMLRLPNDLKERVSGAAATANQSMNALIVSVLEKEFPHPSINLHDVANFLNTLTNEAAGDGSSFVDEVNEALATAESPWCVACEEGRVIFYPYECAPSKTRERAEAIRRLVEKGLQSE